MPHIHTRPGQHDLTASAFIIDISEETPRLWLHLHKKLHVLLQFGGHVELDENPWQAVQREIVEESGFAMDQLQLLQPAVPSVGRDARLVWPQAFAGNTHPIGSDHFHDDLAFAFVTRQQPRNPLAADESHDLRLLSLAEIEAADPAELGGNIRPLARAVLTDILADWQAVDCAVFNR